MWSAACRSESLCLLLIVVNLIVIRHLQSRIWIYCNWFWKNSPYLNPNRLSTIAHCFIWNNHIYELRWLFLLKYYGFYQLSVSNSKTVSINKLRTICTSPSSVLYIAYRHIFTVRDESYGLTKLSKNCSFELGC